MATYRIGRINKELLRLISSMLTTRIKKDEASEAILTEVAVSRDLSFAKVYYTLLDHTRIDAVQPVLDAAAVPIRAMLGKELYLRTIPELHFIYDDSEDKAREMDDLLDRVAAHDAQLKGESI